MALDVFWTALLRRWYLVVAALVCAVGATMLVVGKIGPNYAVEGTVLLFPPTTTIERSDQSVTQGNPYLYLGGLNPARDILIRSLTSKSARDEIAKQEPGATYEMFADISSSGPILVIDVSAPSAESSTRTLKLLMDRVPDTLVDLQTGLGIKEPAYITSMSLTADTRPEVIRKNQIRAGIVAGAGTLAMGLLVIGLYDGLRGTRRSGHSPPPRGRRARATTPDSPPRPGRRAAVTPVRHVEQPQADDDAESLAGATR